MSATDPVQAVAEALAGHPSMESEPGYNPWTGGALLHQVCAGCGMQLAEGRKSRALGAFGHHLASVAVAAARPLIAAEALREAADNLYGDERANGDHCHPLSVASWLRERADDLESGR